MNRKQLLEQTLLEEKNTNTILEATLKSDNKFLKRTKRELEDKIEDLEEQIQNRLAQPEAIDKSVVENLYNSLVDTKSTLTLYQEFEKSFIN